MKLLVFIVLIVLTLVSSIFTEYVDVECPNTDLEVSERFFFKLFSKDKKPILINNDYVCKRDFPYEDMNTYDVSPAKNPFKILDKKIQREKWFDGYIYKCEDIAYEVSFYIGENDEYVSIEEYVPVLNNGLDTSGCEVSNPEDDIVNSSEDQVGDFECSLFSNKYKLVTNEPVKITLNITTLQFKNSITYFGYYCRQRIFDIREDYWNFKNDLTLLNGVKKGEWLNGDIEFQQDDGEPTSYQNIQVYILDSKSFKIR